MSLPYRYELLIRVEIKGDGIESGGDGAKATATRLAALLETDSHVISADPWPGIEYKGKHFEPEPEPKDGAEREEPWGSGAPGTSTHMMTLRYEAEYGEWMVVGEARIDPRGGNAAVRYDRKTEPAANVPICDSVGGHVGWASWEEWSSWPIIETEGEST